MRSGALGAIRSRRRMAAAPALGILRTRRRSAARRARRTVSDQSPLRRVARTMPRKLSAIAPDWWDYTTLDAELIDDAARLTARDLPRLSRPGFHASCSTTRSKSSISPRRSNTSTRGGRAPTTARSASAGRSGRPSSCRWSRGSSTRSSSTCAAVISGAWTSGSTTAPAAKSPVTHPLSFERADRELCFNRIAGSCGCPTRTCTSRRPTLAALPRSWDAGVRCAVMQGGQGEVKHWAFNDPLPREGTLQGRAAAAGGVSQAGHARRRSASQ